jgi:hypothetical protein
MDAPPGARVPMATSSPSRIQDYHLSPSNLVLTRGPYDTYESGYSSYQLKGGNVITHVQQISLTELRDTARLQPIWLQYQAPSYPGVQRPPLKD